MWDLILDCVLDALKDGAFSLPVLFIAYLLMELLERSGKFNENMLRVYSRASGPALGGVLGAIPQCGISGAAATLFSTGTITVGTMLAVFFATSDEMLPVMLSALTDGGIGLGRILAIVAGKAALGVILGYAVDAIFGRFFRAGKDIHSFCEREHCECEGEENVWLSALKHTVKIGIMLIAVNFALNIIFGLIGEERLAAFMTGRPVAAELLLALFGLIPNCAVSVIITQSYLAGVVTLGGLFAGLLSNAGIGLLVLLRTNRNAKENMAIIAILYVLSALCGMAITAISALI